MNTEAIKHRLSLMDRRQLELSGVKDVVSFDESNVVLQTVCGMLSVEGEELHVQVLNTESGVVSLEGTVNAVTYYRDESADKNGGNGFFGRLFR